MEQPNIQVGILAAQEILFELKGRFVLTPGGLNFADKCCPGPLRAFISDNGIILQQPEGNRMNGKVLLLHATSPDCSFILRDVTIGIDFHWEQKEDQRFRGDLKLIIENGKVRAINIIPQEEYLRSVISSEMSATSSPELLKAHAVISRSWLLAQIEKSKKLKSEPSARQATQTSENEHIRWYDREDHLHFDVCADDHCQRYQGITKIISEKADHAVMETFGEVLLSIPNNEICDTRFSKCCGGMSESFENVWEPVPHSYLTTVRDYGEPDKAVPAEVSAVTRAHQQSESEAEKWIRSNPPAFCNTRDLAVLSQVLPGFDQATSDFYRWKVEYSQKQLSTLLFQKTGIDFGEILRLKTVERGYSARLVRLEITGTKKTIVLGKELEIRRALSGSHLYSSAFVVDHLEPENGIPQKFIITGAGWGHGVGLCQIGAAVMGEKGYNYHEILDHYFKHTTIKKIYG